MYEELIAWWLALEQAAGLPDATYHRRVADRARWLADFVSSTEISAKLLRTALEYDAMAEALETKSAFEAGLSAV